MNLNPQTIHDQFIQKLFQHPHFQQKIKTAFHSYNHPTTTYKTQQINFLVEDITKLIVLDIQSLHERIYKQTQEEIQILYIQINKLKDSWHSQMTKVDSSVKSIGEQCIFEDEQFELSLIKQNINNLQQKMKGINLNSSYILDNSQILKQNQLKQDLIQEKINKEICKFELSFSHQQENLEDILNKKIEKQQKTINNILETLNQLHPITHKNQTEVKTLNNCKSAGKLKSFFGFG